VVPSDEVDESMTIESLGEKECIVKYFEDDAYGTAPHRDMRIFDPNKEPFITYGKEYGAQFINHPAVIRALECLRNGEPPAEFKWDYWMRPAGSRRTSQSNSPNIPLHRISLYPKNVDPIQEMDNDTNDTEKQFRLYAYHINNKDNSENTSHDNTHHNPTTESTFDHDDNEESKLQLHQPEKDTDNNENLTKIEPTDQEPQIPTPSVPKKPKAQDQGCQTDAIILPQFFTSHQPHQQTDTTKRTYFKDLRGRRMLTRSQTRGVPGAVSTSRYVTVAQITRDNIIGHTNPARANITNHSSDSLQGTTNMDISKDGTGEDLTTPPVRKERRGRKPWKKKALAEASGNINTTEQSGIHQNEVSSTSTAPIQSEVVYVVPKKRGPGRPRKKPIPEPVIVEQRIPVSETNEHEEVSASSDTGTTIMRRSPKRRRETSVSSKSDNNDDIPGCRRRTIKKKQAVKVPWYRRRRLLPIEALPADDQRTLAMFDFIKSDVSAEELEGLYQKAYKYMKDLKIEYRSLKAQERKLTKQINARIRENSISMRRVSPGPVSPLTHSP
ncbi:3372_t:CDS:2, partial [Paraglomus occultum]